MKLPRFFPHCAAVLALGFAVHPSNAAMFALTGGQAGEGLTLVPADVVLALGVSADPSTIQGVLFSTQNVFAAPVFINGVQSNYGNTANFGNAHPDDTALQSLLDPGGVFGANLIGTISTLTPGSPYKIELFMGNNGSDRNQTISIGGLPAANFTLLGNTAAVVSNDAPVLADVNGEIQFTISSTTDVGLYGGIVVTSAVPEPSTMLFGLLGTLALGFCRRRTVIA